MTDHPFPPIVRWVLAPVFLAAGGALGGFAAGAIAGEVGPARLGVAGGGLALAAALGLAVTVRPWPAVLATPLVGIFIIVGLFVAAGAGTADRLLSELFSSGFVLVPAAALECLILPHLVYLHRPIGRWGDPLACYLTGGVVWPAIFMLLERVPNEGSVFLFGLLVGGAQLPALMAARAVAARLPRSVD